MFVIVLVQEQIWEAGAERIHQEERRVATCREEGKVEVGMGDDLAGKVEHPVGSLA